MPNTEVDNLILNPVSIDEVYIHVVAAIIWKHNKRQQFLITQRQKGKHLEYYWEFPGGKLEAGESPLQALKRELDEEINIALTRASAYMQLYYRYPDQNILLDTWVVEDYQGEIKPMENQAIHWVDVGQTDLYRFPPADVPVIEAIKNNAKAEISRLP